VVEMAGSQQEKSSRKGPYGIIIYSGKNGLKSWKITCRRKACQWPTKNLGFLGETDFVKMKSVEGAETF